MDTTRAALLIGTIGAVIIGVLVFGSGTLLSMFRPVPEAPTSAPTVISEVPTEAPTTTPVPLPTPDPAPTEIPTTEPATIEPEQADSNAVPEDAALAQLQQSVLQSFNCTRDEAGLTTYEISLEITEDAYRASEALAEQNLDVSDIKQAMPGYVLYDVVTLEPGKPQSGCEFDGYDASFFMPELADITEIGIAVFPGVEYLEPSTIVLGR